MSDGLTWECGIIGRTIDEILELIDAGGEFDGEDGPDLLVYMRLLKSKGYGGAIFKGRHGEPGKQTHDFLLPGFIEQPVITGKLEP